MSDIVQLRSGALAQYDPAKVHYKIAGLDAARRHAQAIKDWDALVEAVREQINEQKEFVEWWDDRVTPNKVRKSVSADRGTQISMSQAEEEFKIRNQQVSRWRRALRNMEKYAEELRGPSYKKAMGENTTRGTEGTGENEWYTPEEYLDLARAVLGEIDLDPASNTAAQQIVKAKTFFTREQNGLVRDWGGRVWLNPPYAQPLISDFVNKIVLEYRSGRVDAAIMLTHNYTDTTWFQESARTCSAICFTRGRVKFYDSDGVVAAPTQGQAFAYFGTDIDLFSGVFGEVGFVVRPVRS